MAEEPIYVTPEDFESEERRLYELDTRLAELEDRLDAFVSAHPERLIVSREEYEREQLEIQDLERRLRDEFSHWGHYMALRRVTLRRSRTAPTPAERAYYARAAAAYLGLIRRTRRTITEIQRRVRDARARLARKLIRPPWIEDLLREISEVREELQRERERFERKVVMNKLVALHKRWYYESPRGRYHDISIEGVASIIIPPDEKKEDYEQELRSALEEHLFAQPGFERLTGLKQEVVGFQEKYTRQPTRGVEIETLKWWHKVFTQAQLRLDDFLRGVD